MATEVSVDLVEAERRARHHAPSARIVRQGSRPADQIETGIVDVDLRIFLAKAAACRRDQAAEVLRRAIGLALAGAAVVAHEEEDGVLPLAHLFEGFAKATEVLIDVVDHAREHCLVASEQLLLLW